MKKRETLSRPLSSLLGADKKAIVVKLGADEYREYIGFTLEHLKRVFHGKPLYHYHNGGWVKVPE